MIANPSSSSVSSGPSNGRAGGWNPARRIRPGHAVYAAAMVGASLATFGLKGLLPGVAIVATWMWVFLRSSRPQGLNEAALFWIVAFVLWQLLAPQVSGSRELAPGAACSNNLRQISLALRSYHDRYGTLPPAYVAGRVGRPMHSWRVLILPFLERNDLYAQYRFDEPWDSPHNRTLAAQMPRVFACPGDERSSVPGNTMTGYLAVVGPTTAWPGEQGRFLPPSGDGLGNTLLLMESRTTAVDWMQPRDLDFTTALRLLTAEEPSANRHVSEGFFYSTYSGRRLVLADGAILRGGLYSPEAAEVLLKFGDDDGGVDIRSSGKSPAEVRRINYGNCFRLAVFLLLAALPLPWVFREWPTVPVQHFLPFRGLHAPP